jgi:pyruvate/2-oxoglutarate dehydrogenase complex dihydrolipoamide dehydrogenase (E3) component
MSHERYDAIVIGAGQGGGPIASAFARDGRKTALIERAYAGGTCINTGCTPTKTMIASGRVAHVARRSSEFGIHTGGVKVDMAAVRQRKRDIVESFRGGSKSRIDDTEGLDYLEGEARFVGEKTLEVSLNGGGTRTLHADTIVLDVGERPRELDIDNPGGVDVLNSTSVMELDEVPDHLVVIGGGAVGLEFGQLFRRLGGDVTIVHHSGQLLSREDPDIADAVAGILREDGITIELDASPTRIDRSGNGVRLTIERKDGATATIDASQVLAAAGRVPNTDSLDVEQTGLELDKRGYIETDDRLETKIPGIYAIGDIRPGPKFTHISYDDYRILKANLIDGGDRKVSDRQEPYTTFIDPQLGRVGLSEGQARKQGVPYKVGKLLMSGIARAIETGETRGVMKVLVHAETDRILGAAVLGPEGGEIMAMLQVAMMGNLPYTALRDGVFTHPNLSEALNNVFASLEAPS